MESAQRSVAVVGAAVPIELVFAAGLVPVRLSGAPRPTPLADAYGIGELDGPTTAAFEQLLEGSYRFALIGSDTLPQTILFQALREIQRVEPVEALPDFALVDVLHLPYRTTARYDRGQLVRIVGVLERWSGQTIGNEGLRAAIEATNESRRQAARDAELQAERSAPHEGVRVYLTGTAPEDPVVYALLASRGCAIVGEEHASSGIPLGDEISLEGDLLAALAEHYQLANVATRRSIADRAAYVTAAALSAGAEAIVSFTYAHDGTTPWDVPSLREAAEAAGLRFVSLPPQPFGAVDPEAIVL
jgi:2-hydroxyglutaryl-CoA dehydratase, D-component